MATTLSFAQHFIECENCEENPAQFLCKTCPGHLCDSCKAEHERRKITHNHDIIHLTSEKGDIMEPLYCTKHTTEKMKWYCSPCQRPVCTQCMMETHNGHKVENLATVYNMIKGELEKEKEEILTTLLPKYEKLLVKEKKKKTDISKRTDQVQKHIEDHTARLINRLTTIKTEKVQLLRQEEQRALKSVSNPINEIERRIKALNEIEIQISNNLSAKPGITFFKATNGNSLYKMRRYPNSMECNLDNFSPGKIERKILDMNFGDVPSFRMVESSASKPPSP